QRFDTQNALKACDADVGHYHDYARGQELAHKFFGDRNGNQIVFEAHEKQDNASSQQLLHTIAERSKNGERRHEARKHRYAAKAGRERLVHGAAVGRIEQIFEVRNKYDGRHREHRH
nr:hypothetical protein [Tanacetum cinerariifolium]